MTAAPMIVFLGGAVALGAGNLALRLLGRRTPMLINIHIAAGIGALSVLVIFLKGAGDGDGLPAGAYGNVAAGLLALTLFIGLVNPVLARDHPVLFKPLLAAHIACGAIGAATAVLWANSF